MITQEYREQILVEIEKVGLSLELYEEKICSIITRSFVTPTTDKSRIGKIIRMYIVSIKLGGTLAVNHSDGWIPAYPAKPNYPIKFGWYSPGWQIYTPKPLWYEAVIDAFEPEKINSFDSTARKITIERASKLRNPFRAIVVSSILKNFKK